MKHDFFPQRPEVTPTIYAYTILNAPDRQGLLKVGFTERSAEKRVKEQLQTSGLQYKIVLEESAMRNDGTSFSDHEVHTLLRKKGIQNPDGEWFRCSTEDVKAAILAIKDGSERTENRTLDFEMRPEQAEAVKKTIGYFKSYAKENPDSAPHFLWNAKMRFGKTFASYQLAKKQGWKKILILTFKPAVESAWQEDLATHIDFEGWQFTSKKSKNSFEDLNQSRPIVCFGSFQDFLGKNAAGGIKAKNEWVHATHWDCVIFDEYHYGAWREKSREMFENESEQERAFAEDGGLSIFEKAKNEDIEKAMPITTNHYLYLSGTPFRAISSGEFIEEQIYNWTYSDEQNAKQKYQGQNNPYEALPRMVMLTYQMPESIKHIAQGGEYNEFDLNAFFSAEEKDGVCTFVHEEYVQKWLNLIRGDLQESRVDDLKKGTQRPALPFSDTRLLNILNHTFWLLPSIASCHAMANLMRRRHNTFYHDYHIIVAAGNEAGIGVEAMKPVLKAMGNPLKTKTITLSCGKLTTGVSIKPWTGMLMLRNLQSPETYFQSAFRVQTPWVIANPDGKNPNKKEVIKKECYVFDFAPNRALSQVQEYSSRLNVEESDVEKKVAEFIQFLPILAYDGSSMKQIDAAGVLDIAMSGTTATLLARRWESALLVNVDNATLQKLLNHPKAMKVLMSIEGFRSLNQDIETIINKSEDVLKAKKSANQKSLSKKKRKELSAAEKEYKSRRKQIQEKLIKFATRIPVFMYLTDYRERTLKDVITELEPNLFKKVTGLTVKDFELLVSLNVFNSSLMNDAVYKFKRYEDASINYVGLEEKKGEVGLYDTVLHEDEPEILNEKLLQS